MPADLSLYRLEDDLACLTESGAGVPPGLEQQYLEDLGRALTQAKDKRDAVARFLAHCTSQVELAKNEIERLEARKRFFERVGGRLRNYVRWVIQNVLGADEEGRWKRLEGQTSTLSLRKCPPAVEVQDEAAVPAEYKRLLIELPAEEWERHIQACGDKTILDRIFHVEVKLDRRAMLAAMQQGIEVPGAGLRPIDYTLQVR